MGCRVELSAAASAAGDGPVARPVTPNWPARPIARTFGSRRRGTPPVRGKGSAHPVSAAGPSTSFGPICAAWQGSVACVRAILAHPRGRALVNARDATWHAAPLGWCVHGSTNCENPGADHAAVARLLVEAGSVPDPEWQDMPAWLEALLRGASCRASIDGVRGAC